MTSTILSGGIRGIYCYPVQVEVDISRGLPGFDMVGYLGAEVREARERVKIALKNAGYPMPAEKVTVNLSPADIRKEGTAYDLPIAIGVIQSMGLLNPESTDRIFFVGELGLTGEIRAVNGVLPMVLEMKKRGISTCIVPKENALEGAVVEGMQIYGVQHILQVLTFLQNPVATDMKPEHITRDELESERKQEPLDFADIQGQEVVRRAAEIAAAGFHHLLMVGPPGSGKTMIASRMPSILPTMCWQERLEVSAVYSVAGLLKKGQALVTQRPFLSPHHTVTGTALAGGGNIPRPGIISQAHRGVLFLDELTEFRRETIEILRQPMEDKKVQIARYNRTVSYPADCLVVAAMNPCPCGNYPNRNQCTCTQAQIDRYLGKVSGPILDRMDLIVEAKKIPVARLRMHKRGESSETIRSRITKARSMQEKRLDGTGLYFNGEMKMQHIQQFCRLGVEENRLLDQLFGQMNLSARAYYKIIKVARTIADLDGEEQIQKKHLAEAVCYRNTLEQWKGV